MREFALPLDIQASLTIQKNSPCGNLQTLRKQQVPLSALQRFLNWFYVNEKLKCQQNSELGGAELHKKTQTEAILGIVIFPFSLPF